MNPVAVEGTDAPAGVIFVSPSRWIEILRSGQFELGLGWSNQDITGNLSLSLLSGYDSTSNSEDLYERFINIEPLIAYQLACSQFATNDFVDFIYSAKLFRDNLQSLFISDMGSFPSFEYNGISCLYDVFLLMF